jgi:hypothetical protein
MTTRAEIEAAARAAHRVVSGLPTSSQRFLSSSGKSTHDRQDTRTSAGAPPMCGSVQIHQILSELLTHECRE